MNFYDELVLLYIKQELSTCETLEEKRQVLLKVIKIYKADYEPIKEAVEDDPILKDIFEKMCLLA